MMITARATTNRPRRGHWRRAICLTLLIADLRGGHSAAAAPVASLDDIEYWVGDGSRRAAIVIDWDAGSTDDEALVWGYRWEDAATGADVLRAVLAADKRLLAKLRDGGALGIGVYGFGYDANDDGQFQLSDGTEFDADGVAFTGLPDEDATPLDPADAYREGWFAGAWSYGLAAANPWSDGDWAQSRSGPSSRALVDGGWDSWAFISPIELNAFAANPVAAEPPGATATADFDSDGDVDGADLLAWQRGFGLTSAATRQRGDANGDLSVDAADLAAWKPQFGTSEASLATIIAVPEPAGLFHVAWLAVCMKYAARRKQRHARI